MAHGCFKRLQGIKVTPASGGSSLAADLVFVVDNSASMGEEADTIANKIVAFTRHLAAFLTRHREALLGRYGGDEFVVMLSELELFRSCLPAGALPASA